ncbi:MAG: hypothetical protein KBA32_11725 [Propionivibrio sp.]|jgi:hypothetical protein|uniref:c-type cytochrome domain-containing protein n=1 Tax=Propionivibrio sp. TaxID=2212460 RepID=UPI001B6EF926|nr:c-type cytochrome domain-containing protein [Propionivibrio sp.]MBP7203860.1 hypothetical protein [Propionivibrio sp.]
MKSAILQTSLLSVCALLLSACAEKEVSFKADIQPILVKNCLECHAAGGAGAEKSGLLMSSYEDLMKGTRFGAIVKPGDALTSALIMLVEGRVDPSIRMPHHKEPLNKDQIAQLRAWVEQGAKNN